MVGWKNKKTPTSHQLPYDSGLIHGTRKGNSEPKAKKVLDFLPKRI
jgi:hypothetical protein